MRMNNKSRIIAMNQLIEVALHLLEELEQTQPGDMQDKNRNLITSITYNLNVSLARLAKVVA